MHVKHLIHLRLFVVSLYHVRREKLWKVLQSKSAKLFELFRFHLDYLFDHVSLGVDGQLGFWIVEPPGLHHSSAVVLLLYL